MFIDSVISSATECEFLEEGGTLLFTCEAQRCWPVSGFRERVNRMSAHLWMPRPPGSGADQPCD